MLHRRAVVAGLAVVAAPAILRSHRAAAGSVVSFQQPTFTSGIEPHFSVTGQEPAANPKGAFYLHANQPNPYRSDSRFVPVRWGAGRMTGLYCPGDRAHWQRGIWVPSPSDAAVGTGNGHTVAQVCGGVVGAFLNSTDLFDGSPGNRMMIAPSYRYAHTVTPLAAPGSLLAVSLDLQVPHATNVVSQNLSNAYAKIDLLFVSLANGARMSLSCGLFANGGSPKQDGAGFDSLTNTAIAMAFAAPFSRLVTLAPGSAQVQSQPWSGFETFSFTFSQAQLAAALAIAAPQAKANGFTLSLDPTGYALSGFHLNAELHYTATLPATLGWSMQNLTVQQL